MIKRIVHFALNQPLFIILGLVLFIGLGISAFRSLPIEAFPDVTDTQVTIISLYPGRAPEEVEKQVTIPLEIALAGVPNSIRMFSHTQFGLSFIVVTFDEKPSLFMARQLIQERLRGLDLPAGVEPELAPPATATGEIFRYRLEAPGLKASEIRAIQDWTVARHIKQVPGIADVVSFGGPIRQYEVRPNLDKLRDYKLTIGQLFSALQRANANAGGGSVAQGRQQFLIRSLGLLHSSADIGQVVIAENKGTPIFVRDVAEVVESRVPEQGIVGVSDAQGDQDDVVSGIVLLRKDENPSMVLDALKAKVDTLNSSVLPSGVKLIPFYDRSWLISKTLKTVFMNLLEGALLVTLVLYLFLADLRAAGIVASIIPLALLGTFMGLSAVGIPANLLSLGAMDFGIIVDGAVIVIENIFRRLGEAHRDDDHRPQSRTIQEAVIEIGRPTVFSMIIIIVAHLPIFTMQRHEGKIFAPMAYSVVAALITSLILSLTLVPFLSKIAFKNHVPHEETKLMHWFMNRYEPALKWVLANTKRVLLIALGALAFTAAMVPQLGTEFLPELNEGSIWINITLPTSVSVDEAKKELRTLRRVIADFPEVNAVISKGGRPEDGTDPKNINMTEMLVDLKPESEWRKGMSKDALVREMEDKLNDRPGIEPTFSQPVRDQILESISQIDGQIVIKLFGDDLTVLKANANQLLDKIGNVPGVVKAFIDRDGDLPQYRLEIDRAAAARYGLNVMDVQDVVETALAGKAATELWEGDRHFSVVLRLDEKARQLDQLKDVLVPTPSGAQIPLASLVDFKLGSGAMNIARESGQRVVAIGVFIRDRDMGSVVADMQVHARDIKLPQGNSITWSGEFENQERAMKRLMLVVPLSILFIFLLLFDAFESFRDALIIICNIPFALIGGIFALLLTGIPLSVSAAIGFIALFGQAVLNGVVMVSYINQLKKEGLDDYQAIFQGAMSRLRTVLMTALLAMLGLLPMALSHGIGSETQRPLALVVIGGLITATILTLFVLPTLYYFVSTHPRFAKALH
ncbi:CusA/CzcA family heavy metal efflux RND transporter [Dechloromonas sp. TW-R-39-2]|uniref:efflux RND transporter permease subunit n=1 Tax=Dechloromonas sp. TW-R-39-2 TaxID=2654218 RepID=UPI00193E0D2E|nr:CusA/CzcA family heavy metal efflux RND transporter [Dechloromonas sp. TW-R-39-2]QRM19871.1 CusA/CzcA family heavy metal efflux RND transporter [Dechloromonas sp. TW-R-39-2]